MTLYILIAAVIIIICLTVSKFSSKIGVPVLLAFIFLGMLFGCDGIFKIQFDNFSFAETICSVTLIKRNNRIVIPKGKTVVKENDILIINKTQR